MVKTDFNSKGYFTKPRFFNLIDSNGKLSYSTLQYYWEEYVISHHQDLDAFYIALDPYNPTSPYIQKSIDFHFNLERKKASREHVKADENKNVYL